MCLVCIDKINLIKVKKGIFIFKLSNFNIGLKNEIEL